MLQLAWLFSSSAYFTRVPPLATCQLRASREALLSAHLWAFFHTLSHTTLAWIPPKYKVSKCWITSKLVWWLGLATWLSRKSELWANCLASLEVCLVVLQLAWLFSSSAYFTHVSPLATCQLQASREALLSAHLWAFLHTLSHTTLAWIPPKYRISKCWITSKLARNKANKMFD